MQNESEMRLRYEEALNRHHQKQEDSEAIK